jgi:hypothetical protein
MNCPPQVHVLMPGSPSVGAILGGSRTLEGGDSAEEAGHWGVLGECILP